MHIYKKERKKERKKSEEKEKEINNNLMQSCINNYTTSWADTHRLMESAFLLDEEGRASFLRFVMQSFGCTYICLWSYLPPPSNCLWFKDGIYHEENGQQPISSSTGSLTRRLFDEYRNSVFMIETDSVPGLAFKNNLPYFEVKELDLRRLASIELQGQFYQEAGIKTAIFMGCKSGEIELGFSNVQTQMNMELEMRNWFPENFSQNGVLSSSSSSLRSISIESPEYPPSLMFNIPTPSSYMPAAEPPFKETPLVLEQALRPITLPTTTTTTTSTTNQHLLLQPIMQAFAQTEPLPFPTFDSDDAAMTRAILAVMSSPPPPLPHQTHHNSPYNNNCQGKKNKESSAFKSYKSDLLAPLPTCQMKPNNNLRAQSMLKRAITYFRSLNLRRNHENNMQGNRPTSTQLHHMISERKRREKLNESFQALRSLLPPGSKRDKASVLANTREYLTTLKAELFDLTRKNQLLEAKLLPTTQETSHEEDKHKKEGEEEEGEASRNEKINVSVTPVPESTSSGERIVNLRVSVRGGGCSKLDMVIHLLEFLKQVENVNLVSMEADTRMAEESSTNSIIDRVVLRLKVEGNEWDESAFKEAIKRVVAANLSQ